MSRSCKFQERVTPRPPSLLHIANPGKPCANRTEGRAALFEHAPKGETFARPVDTTLQSVRGPAARRICTSPSVAREEDREETYLHPIRSYRTPVLPTDTARPPRIRRTATSTTRITPRDGTTEAWHPTDHHRRTADHKAAHLYNHRREQTSK